MLISCKGMERIKNNVERSFNITTAINKLDNGKYSHKLDNSMNLTKNIAFFVHFGCHEPENAFCRPSIALVLPPHRNRYAFTR